MNYLLLRAVLSLAMLAMYFTAPHCTANSSAHNTNGNSVLSKVAGATSGSLPSGNSGISHVLGAAAYHRLKASGLLGAKNNGSGLTSGSTVNSKHTPTGQTAGQKIQDQTPSVTTTITTIGDLNNDDVSSGATRGTPGSSGTPPTVQDDGTLVDNLARSVPAAPVSVDPLPNSQDQDSADHVNDVEGHDAATGVNDKSKGGKKSSNGEDSSDRLSRPSENGSRVISATTTSTTKPVKPDASKEALTRDISGGSRGSQSLSPTPQNPASNGTPAAQLTRAHTTAPDKPGEGQTSVKVTTTTTSTNSAAQSAQEPAAANPAEQDTTQLQTLKSTTSTAAPTASKETSATSTSEFTKGESTASPTSFPKLSEALQSLDMKDSSIGSSLFFALAALATFFVMAVAPAC